MDIDIEDILAELDRDTTAVDESLPSHDEIPSESNTTSHTLLNNSLETGLNNDKNGKRITTTVATDNNLRIVSPELSFKQLMTCWRNERCAPELLPFPHELMKRMMSRIQEQMEYIENISMGFLENDHTHYSDHSPQDRNKLATDDDPVATRMNSNHDSKLPLLCMEAEIERVKFVIRSFIRCRLSKIDKFSLYLRQLKEDDTNIISLDEILSREELEYHERHFLISLKLLNDSVLKYMPTELQAINDTEGSVNMIEEPDWNKFVFIHVVGPPDGNLEKDSSLTTNEFNKYCYSVTIPELKEDVELTINSIYVMRYEVIRDLLKAGKVELI
ncbi:DNA replication protein SLD5 NDAI_0A07080 [Naumovozyma dairenensis CBS 421]|uniref:DNA replication complex GINS protein SLD5 n=1 Tax=Naumovozyma dairenensis (strain ATCC 10597 / BCRC 20456 / CBS 421 / NBRC 0211 / NRRL Y-12639) TaxID=1071378 RepID=G0W4X4_NAUDC|nr:hypothetical protein NDAI_0A07080 [Naumovozyma dairenensis CBS 421]CCD22862.1 hypothetical protein NDAI_0A07080 [Naumovozyma dairenensis CBS 421]